MTSEEREDAALIPVAGAFGAAQVALAAIPVIGPVLVSALGEYRTERRLRRLERFGQQLDARLDALRESHMDSTYLRSEEYVDYVIRTAELAAEAHRSSKIDLLAAVAAGATARGATDVLRDKFLRVAEECGPEHVRALRDFRAGEVWLAIRDDLDEQRLPSEELADVLPGEVLETVVRDLVTLGLLEDAGMGRIGVTAGEVWRLTSPGRLFLDFLAQTRYEPR